MSVDSTSRRGFLKASALAGAAAVAGADLSVGTAQAASAAKQEFGLLGLVEPRRVAVVHPLV
jgi:anaerobic selenocysteine-containing dehydrogenase